MPLSFLLSGLSYSSLELKLLCNANCSNLLYCKSHHLSNEINLFCLPLMPTPTHFLIIITTLWAAWLDSLYHYHLCSYQISSLSIHFFFQKLDLLYCTPTLLRTKPITVWRQRHHIRKLFFYMVACKSYFCNAIIHLNCAGIIFIDSQHWKQHFLIVWGEQ